MRQRSAGRLRPRLRLAAARYRPRALAQPCRQEHGHGVFQGLAHCERSRRPAGLQTHRARRRPRIHAHPRRRASHSGLRGAAGRHQQRHHLQSQRAHRQHQRAANIKLASCGGHCLGWRPRSRDRRCRRKDGRCSPACRVGPRVVLLHRRRAMCETLPAKHRTNHPHCAR